MKICDGCGIEYLPTGTRQRWCSKTCRGKNYRDAYKDPEYQRNYLLNNWSKKTISLKRSKAEKADIPFDIEPEDIPLPEFCPVLGIRLEISSGGIGPQDNSPTVDRIDSTKGYIKGNVIVISMKANRIKSNASAEEIGKVYEWVRQLTP